MAGSAEVIVLSSSPNPPPRTPIGAVHGTAGLADILPRQGSPPPLRSPPDLFDRPLHSRFFTAPLMRDVPVQKKPRKTTKSTAAASLGGNALEQPIPRTESKELKTASPRNLVPKTQDPLYKESKKKTARKTRTTTGNKKNEMNNMTLTGKVTKGRNDIQTKESDRKRKKSTILKEKRDEPPNPTVLGGSEAGMNDEELYLDGALRRRNDWTPVRDTAPNSGPTMEENEGTQKTPQPIPEEFDKLISNYDYSGASSAAHETLQNLGGEGPTKRRRIELVNPLLQQFQPQHADSNEELPKQDKDSSMPGPQSKKKSKGPKRLTTLTARMTAQYSLTNTKDVDSASGGLDISRNANTERSKGQGAGNEAMFTVLSPKDAFQSLDNQDLVFGTCSQLEREDSPQTTGEMQQAIRAPESLSLVESKQDIPSKTIAKEPMSYRPGTRNLWRVAARNTEGSLVQAQMTSGVSLQSSSALASKGQNVKAKGSLNWEDEDWFELDYGKPYTNPKKKTPLPKTSARPVPSKGSEVPVPAEEGSEKTTFPQDKTAQEPQMPHYSGFTDAELTKQVGAFGFKSIRGRKKMIELLQKCWESKHGSINKTGVSQTRPSPPTDIVEPSSSTQSQLHDPTTESGSQKKAAQRNGQSKKNTTIAQNSSAYPTPPTIYTNKPTSRSRMEASRGSERSSQTHSSSFINVEEIQDSEDETVPSPSQALLSNSSDFVSVSSFDIKPKELNACPTKPNRKSKNSSASTSGKSDRPVPSKRNSLPNLAAQITKAVRSQHLLSPLSTISGSRNRPTWHEKILMYDPVILEDFTTWLNIEGLGLVGEDREVHVAAAREWCENKGICCCWKNNAGW